MSGRKGLNTPELRVIQAVAFVVGVVAMIPVVWLVDQFFASW